MAINTPCSSRLAEPAADAVAEEAPKAKQPEGELAPAGADDGELGDGESAPRRSGWWQRTFGA